MPAPPQRKLHLTNSKGRDATVLFGSLKGKASPSKGLVGHTVVFRRYLASTQDGTHAALSHAHSEDGAEDYAQALVDGDPEVDMEQIGRVLGDTSQVFLSATGEVMHAPPKMVEVRYGPDGAERERKQPEDRESNANDELPVRWTGRRIKKADAVRRFVFSRTIALSHQDGLTYDYLHGMAQELADSGELVIMGGGEDGKQPLVLQTNGTPYRAFLEGRVDGARYQLLLHLSNMELKLPSSETDAKSTDSKADAKAEQGA